MPKPLLILLSHHLLPCKQVALPAIMLCMRRELQCLTKAGIA